MSAVRKRRIRAADDGIAIDVTVVASVKPGRLTRDEHDRLINALTSAIMPHVPDAPFIRVHLSEVKVTRT